jgi:hypothetical protein
MKLEHYIMEKPHPRFVLKFDGRDVVLSIGKFYFRIKRSN